MKHTLTKEQAARIDLWCDELESGKWKQGREQLRISGRQETFHCCLGVACELAAAQGVGAWKADMFSAGGQTKCGLLPDAVAEWMGLPEDEGLRQDGSSLTEFNDGEEDNDLDAESFPEIAARIRRWKADECEVLP